MGGGFEPDRSRVGGGVLSCEVTPILRRSPVLVGSFRTSALAFPLKLPSRLGLGLIHMNRGGKTTLVLAAFSKDEDIMIERKALQAGSCQSLLTGR